MPKRTEHRRNPEDVEITRFELMRIFDGDEDWLRELEHNFFCGDCHVPNRRLLNYRVMVTPLNDIALQGTSRVQYHRRPLRGNRRGAREGEADKGGAEGEEEGVTERLRNGVNTDLTWYECRFRSTWCSLMFRA